MHKLETLIKNAYNILQSVSQASELEAHASNEFTIQNQHQSRDQTAISSLLVLISGVLYFVLRSCLVSFVSQNRSESSTVPVPIFLAGSDSAVQSSSSDSSLYGCVGVSYDFDGPDQDSLSSRWIGGGVHRSERQSVSE